MATCTVLEMETKVKDLLKSLGTGPNKIADSLKERKIKGYKGEADQCPIAKLIKKQFKNLKYISSDSDGVQFALRGEECSVNVPKAVEKFMEKFDNGDYPELALKELYE